MQDQQSLRQQLLFAYLPGDDGKPASEAARIVKAFARKHYRLQFISDLYQAAYLAVITSVDRATQVENPRGYIAVAIRHAMLDAIEADEFVPYPRYAREVKKLPRPQREQPIFEQKTRTYREAVYRIEDRPHLNGQLAEICEGLSADESRLIVWLAEGYTLGEIADKLAVNYRTANSRIVRLRRKLDLAREQGITYSLAQEIINRTRRGAKSASHRSADSAPNGKSGS